MSEYIKYKLTFPVKDGEINPAQIRVTDSKLTFSIGHIKTRLNPAVIYFIFYGFDYHKTKICEYTSDRMVVSTEYTQKHVTFDIPFFQKPNSTKYYNTSDLDNYCFDIILIGVDSENPLYLNHIQLEEGDFTEYHKPNEEINNVKIGFNRNSYVNLYDMSETYLQVIRPNHEDITSEQLTKSQMTILAPHLPNESVHDDPLKVFYEFMYMTEQRIGVEK